MLNYFFLYFHSFWLWAPSVRSAMQSNCIFTVVNHNRFSDESKYTQYEVYRYAPAYGVAILLYFVPRQLPKFLRIVNVRADIL